MKSIAPENCENEAVEVFSACMKLSAKIIADTDISQFIRHYDVFLWKYECKHQPIYQYASIANGVIMKMINVGYELTYEGFKDLIDEEYPVQ